MMIKDLKQHFGFNQFKGSKYQAQVNDLSIRCIMYIMLCSQKEREPQKSMYQIVFEFNMSFEAHCIEIVNRYFFSSNIESFLEFAESLGLVTIRELREQCKGVLDSFFASEFYEDKIIEIDEIDKIA